ncbi:hypothetical protein MMC10_003602 [Thelotrema lepadinum]|nr:hypothetical protein [Thelotrema lepadinum]
MSNDHNPHQYSTTPYQYSSAQQSQATNYPSPSPYKQSSEMATMPQPPAHTQQDLYRPHNSYDMYQNPPPQMSYPPPGSQQGQGQPQVSFNQPAPRQRTAIACRYCRRRKIRCHGFDSSPDGRCTNCLRFHQECIFTPVSSQAHAFVPAHTAYPHLRNTGSIQTGPDGRPLYGQGQPGPVLYGAHGQPLGPVGQQQNHDSHYPPPQSYGSSPYPAQAYDDRAPTAHTHDNQRLGLGTRRGSSGGAYEYPDPTHMAPVSPASSTTSYQAAPYPPQAPQPYYHSSQPPPRRSSPPSAYPYDARTPGSPHGSSSSAGSFPPFPAGLHPPQVLPPAFETGRTPTPSNREANTAANGSRPGMSVRDILGPNEGGQGTRSSHDSDMLKALNRRGMS